MLRKTLTIVSLIGLLLSLGLWGVNYLNIGYYLARGEGAITLDRGGIRWSTGSPLLIVFSPKGDEGEAMPDSDGQLTGGPIHWEEISGCHYAGFRDFETIFKPVLELPRNARLPLWLPALLCLAGSCLSLFHGRRRRKRKKLGLCVKCGYDLRASKDRCPECGESFPK